MTISVASLRALLRARADPVNAAGAQRFFAGGVKTYGVHREELDGMAREALRALKTSGGLAAALRVAGGLYRSGNMDEAALATRLLARFSREMGPEHFGRFDRWVDSLSDWASTDSLSTQVIGPVVRDHPELIHRLAVWTGSRHRWRRRAALVSLIPLARTGERLSEIFAVTDRALGDPDEMVQKGTGWLLKEATRKRAGGVVAYLVTRRDLTTRLVLRYASEKLTPAQRARVLAVGPQRSRRRRGSDGRLRSRRAR